MSDNQTELDKTIEELEAEVLAELEEAQDAPAKSGTKAESPDKLEGEVQDTGKAVVKPDQGDSPTKKVVAKAKEISGEEPQKSEAKPDKPEKLAAGDNADHDGEELSEAPKTKADHLETFSKMKASEVKEMLAAYQKSIAEKAKDEGYEEEEEDEEVKKEALNARIKEINVEEDVAALINDEDNLSEQFKSKASTIFEAAVKSKVRAELERIEKDMVEETANDMEEYKEELSQKVDSYLNYVVEEWTKENELAIERGLKGEIAEDFIAGLKQLFEDHYIDVPNEKYDVLEAQSEKIEQLESRLNEEIQKNVEIKETNSTLVREQVITEVSEDLADTESEKLAELAKDVDFTDQDSFREKLNTLKESYFPKMSSSSNGETSSNDEVDTGLAQDVDVSKSMAAYMSAISKGNVKSA